jgi:hypothetical protein
MDHEHALRHELMDRVYILADTFSEHIATHEAAEHPDIQARITKLEQELFDLYQAIGDIE